VLVVEDRNAGTFAVGVLGSIAGVFLVCVLAALGFGMTIGGAVWWALRVRARRALLVPAPGYQPGYPSA
jgi:hypothetical protein